mgnify:CR=1 FL=1
MEQEVETARNAPDVREPADTDSKTFGPMHDVMIRGYIKGWMGLLLIAGIALAGCGKSGSGAGGGGFDKAPPEIKAAWEKAVAADRTNDYVTAIVGYKAILQERDTLPRELVKAAEEASGKVFQRVVAASQKGDPDARDAMATLGTIDRSRRGQQ